MKLAVAVTIFAVCSAVQAAAEEDIADLAHIVTLGTRPYYILDEMKPSDLKEKLRELVFTSLSTYCGTYSHIICSHHYITSTIDLLFYRGMC